MVTFVGPYSPSVYALANQAQAGKAVSGTQPIMDAVTAVLNAQPKDTAPADPNNTGSKGSGTTYEDKSNDIAMQQAGANAAPATRDAGLQTINNAVNNITGRYDTEATGAKTAYTDESNSNEQDLQNNKQQALQTAVEGRQGLFGTLASLGALSGTGIERANHAVQQGANQDLAQAANTFATNQNGLDTSYGNWSTADKERRATLNENATNDRTQTNNDFSKNMQSYYKNLGDDYQAEGNTAMAKGFYDKAAALFPDIAKTNIPTMDLGYSGGVYTAPALSQYVGKANNTTVQSTPGNATGSTFNIPGLLALNKRTA